LACFVDFPVSNFITFVTNFTINVCFYAIATSARKSVALSKCTFLDGLISWLVIIHFRDICCCILDACLPEKSEKDFIQQKIMFRQVE